MNSAYMVNGSYMQNIMSKYHKMNYGNVVMLTTNKELMKDGSIEYVEAGENIDDNGVKLIRLDVSRYTKLKNTSALDGLILYEKIYEVLKVEKPDFIIAGTVGSLGNFPIAKYIKKINPNCKVVCRSHATVDNVDVHNHKIRRAVWDFVLTLQNKYMNRYYKRIYGILPNAVDYMINRLGIPREKTALLPLGYDDELICFENKEEIRARIRAKYEIDMDAFLVVHGGKLSSAKKTLEFVRSIAELNTNVSAIIFGDFGTQIYGEKVSSQYENEVKEEANKDVQHKIVFTGALKQNEIYDLYLASDLAVFPGTPSCLRQEAVGAGLPIIMYLNPGDVGININVDNNAIYLNDGWDIQTLSDSINKVYLDKSYSERALNLAMGAYKEYSYRNISRRIVEENM